MPYIKKIDRKEFDDYLNSLASKIQGEGELTYCIYKLCYEWVIKTSSKPLEKLNYSLLSKVISSLENTKIEFYRQIISRYEDKKIEENGDIE